MVTAQGGSGQDLETEKKKTNKIAIIRGLCAVALFVLVGVGLAFHTGTGTISSFGWDFISAICPLGALESLFGRFAFIPRVLILLAIMVIVVLIIGRAFCSWICPVPYVGKFFSTKKSRAKEQAERDEAAQYAVGNWKDGKREKKKKVTLDSRHGILAGALVSTAIFGFPVFCLVCPIGLTFATFILVWRLLQFNEASWGLLIFPLILVIEVVLMRRWCLKICPMGALLSLISKFNKTFRPAVDREVCLRDTKSAACHACNSACPEHLDPHGNLGRRDMSECIKCGSCIAACPVSAIKLKVLPQKVPAVKTVSDAALEFVEESSDIESSAD
ncbi:MAG: 4Fe-4S binding protein [Eggerthellaceae bacterium]|nr:4Fe-4S binding protein [Eggerthellaceae bacterium]